MKKKIFIISGPAGVGKSTTAQALSKTFDKSAYIEGDLLSHMSIAGRQRPWASDQANELVFKNIRDLTRNFLNDGCVVVVDWVIFYSDLKKYISEFIEQGVELKYLILWAEEKTLLNRDKNRPAAVQMNERVLILKDEFLRSNPPAQYFLDTTNLKLDAVLDKIKSEEGFIVS